MHIDTLTQKLGQRYVYNNMYTTHINETLALHVAVALHLYSFVNTGQEAAATGGQGAFATLAI